MNFKKIALTLTTLLLLSCGKSAEDGNKKIDLSVSVWGSSPEETALVDKQIAMFEELHPNIKVTKEVVTGDYNQVLQTNIAARIESDVFYMDSAVTPMYIEKKAILPLNEYLDSEDLKDFNANLLEGFVEGDKIYGLPKDYNPLVLAYNKDMFSAAEVEVPRNWEEWLISFEKLKLAGESGKLGENFMYPMSAVTPGERTATYILQNGGDVFDNENNEVTFNLDAALGGLKFFYNLIKEGYVREPRAMGEGWNGDAFARGKVAMTIEGGWMIPYLSTAAPNLNYGLAKIPMGKEEGTMLFSVAYSMGRNCKNPEAAVEFIKFMTSAKAQMVMIESGLGLPTRKSLNDEFIKLHPSKQAMIDMTPFGRAYNFGKKGMKVASELGKANEIIYIDYVNGKFDTDVKKILDIYAEKAK
ncbi:MAG: ABC transporter substrate-binding protein [Cetobacterium sp.]